MKRKKRRREKARILEEQASAEASPHHSRYPCRFEKVSWESKPPKGHQRARGQLLRIIRKHSCYLRKFEPNNFGRRNRPVQKPIFNWRSLSMPKPFFQKKEPAYRSVKFLNPTRTVHTFTSIMSEPAAYVLHCCTTINVIYCCDRCVACYHNECEATTWDGTQGHSCFFSFPFFLFLFSFIPWFFYGSERKEGTRAFNFLSRENCTRVEQPVAACWLPADAHNCRR